MCPLYHQYLDLKRVYCKPKGQAPDLNMPVILRRDANVLDFCSYIHRDLAKNFGYGLIWGTSVKHRPQRVGKRHMLEDEDVVQIMQKV